MDASPSTTAMMTAVARGRHRLEDPPPWILDDPFALVLVGPAWQDIATRSTRLSDELDRQIRGAVVARSAYAEHRLITRTFEQYVLLGAGLDSFAWRRPDLLAALRVFEVDHPASQHWKRQRVADLGLPVSPRHVFTPIDFERQSLRDGLDAVGFNRGAPTLFSWLGVIPYLTPDAVEATLRTVATCGSGSEVVFEYAVPESDLDDVGREFRTYFVPVASRVGEPVHSRWSAGEAERFVAGCGLQPVDHPTRSDMVDRFCGDRTDGLRPWTVTRLMTAAVP